MADKMLIDASHEEETRVVVVRGNRIEEFDFESQHKKQLRGNIYLAKVTRVEPSLQAAFVDYGGNRHGFLAFSEIHPDYYQIPLADRQALLEDDEEDDDDQDSQLSEPAEAAEKVAEEKAAKPKPRTRRGRGKSKTTAKTDDEAATQEAPADKTEAETAEAATAENAEIGNSEDGNENGPSHMAAEVDADIVSEDVDDDEADQVESVGAEDAQEELPERASRKPRKQYRIQEVIKRRQILLVQVAKEERGNKGAALTTYLSLAGRYSVLMPNTARGGGISRKITNPADRKRLKEVAKNLEVPKGMGVILRTAGANRTKAEVKRDFEYLMRLWENVRSKTLTSTAPCLVYEEGSLIKRSIRDLYNKDINEIIVSGEEGYREAKDFMKMLMPSHAKVVQPYRDIHPIYSRSGIEAQLDRMLQPQVTLKSGGYLIINQTEALVAIDVNSGRSTREHSIEDTALQTNLEAAEEVARQLRLRDLAGLVVIDFIDMEEKRNNRAVEKRLKDCLKNDRARIQVGRISHFGLLEMSRQRIRASVLESTTQVCAHCGGTGHVLSQSSVALHVLRGIEEYLLKNTTHDITVKTTPDIALYLLNQKRNSIVDYETRFGLSISIQAEDEISGRHFDIERGEPVENPVKIEALFNFAPEEEEEEVIIEADVEEEEGTAEAEAPRDDESRSSKRKRRRRRRGGRGGQNNSDEAEAASDAEQQSDDAAEKADSDTVSEETAAEAGDDAAAEDAPKRKRRRGKRGGRRNRSDETAAQQDGDTAEASDTEDTEASEAADADVPAEAAAEAEAGVPEEKTETAQAETVEQPAESEPQAAAETVVEEAAPAEQPAAETAVEETAPAKPARRRRAPRKKAAEAEAAPVEDSKVEAPAVDVSKAEEVVPTDAPADASEAVETVTADTSTEEPAAEEPAAEETVETAEAEAAPEPAPAASSEPVVTSSFNSDDEETKKPKRGWWQRRGFF
ncbi:ribonuclease E/G [Martelella alba]|uniref:Ribonuclease E n=1 Tax=Martelella alba TaxID=2590451 RepID=A0A506UJX0_9HYPH|nr:ribonuclease E/G [Martelella alba]TPW33610.1 ribonuclease E/G [Martelella alba]